MNLITQDRIDRRQCGQSNSDIRLPVTPTITSIAPVNNAINDTVTVKILVNAILLPSDIFLRSAFRFSRGFIGKGFSKCFVEYVRTCKVLPSIHCYSGAGDI